MGCGLDLKTGRESGESEFQSLVAEQLKVMRRVKRVKGAVRWR